MKILPALIVSAVGLAFVAASPAEAAKKHRRHVSHTARAMAGGITAPFQRGVLAGPLYNGQDYLGNDPDPNIRAYILRDLGSRYGGSM